jgi:hypothetical protein
MPILAVRQPIFQRAMRIIDTISNSNPAVITTTFDHQYSTGMIVRLNISAGYTMQEVNQQYGPITVLSDTTFSIPIDTTLLNAFVAPTSFPENQQYCQVTPMGEVNSTLIAATQNVLPFRS